MLVVHLKPNQPITAESGAMTYMSPNVQVQTRMREKSILGTLGLSVLGRQSFFVNDYVAIGGPGEAAFVAAPVGDIDVIEITSAKGYVIQKAAYLASTSSVNLDVQWEGFTKGLFGQGLFMIRATRSGAAVHKHIWCPRPSCIRSRRETDCRQLSPCGLQQYMFIPSHRIRRVERDYPWWRGIGNRDHRTGRSSDPNEELEGVCRLDLDIDEIQDPG